jgi:hypothetical protein
LTCCGGKYPFDRTLVASDPADLDALLRTSGRFDVVLLRIDAIADTERTRWEQRLVGAYTECGCDAGGIALLATLAAIAASAFTPHRPTWLAGLGACFAAALLGKGAGIALARLRLWRDVRRIRDLVRISAPRAVYSKSEARGNS